MYVASLLATMLQHLQICIKKKQIKFSFFIVLKQWNYNYLLISMNNCKFLLISIICHLIGLLIIHCGIPSNKYFLYKFSVLEVVNSRQYYGLLEYTMAFSSPFFRRDMLLITFLYIMDLIGTFAVADGQIFSQAWIGAMGLLYVILLITRAQQLRKNGQLWKRLQIQSSEYDDMYYLGLVNGVQTILATAKNRIFLLDMHKLSQKNQCFMYQNNNSSIIRSLLLKMKRFHLESYIKRQNMLIINSNMKILLFKIPQLKILKYVPLSSRHKVYCFHQSKPKLALFHCREGHGYSDVALIDLLGSGTRECYPIDLELSKISQIKLFLDVEEEDKVSKEKFIFYSNKQLFCYNVGSKHGEKVSESISEECEVDVLNQRNICVYDKEKLLILDLPTMLPVKRIECFTQGARIMPVFNMPNYYFIIPKRELYGKKLIFFHKSYDDNQMQTISWFYTRRSDTIQVHSQSNEDTMRENNQDICSITYEEKRHMIVVLCRNSIYICQYFTFEMCQSLKNEGLDFSLLIED